MFKLIIWLTAISITGTIAHAIIPATQASTRIALAVGVLLAVALLWHALTSLYAYHKRPTGIVLYDSNDPDNCDLDQLFDSMPDRKALLTKEREEHFANARSCSDFDNAVPHQTS